MVVYAIFSRPISTHHYSRFRIETKLKGLDPFNMVMLAGDVLSELETGMYKTKEDARDLLLRYLAKYKMQDDVLVRFDDREPSVN